MKKGLCGCGRRKQTLDADMCEACWNVGRAYEHTATDNRFACSCGGTKQTMDASMCSSCYEAGQGYADR